MALVLEVSKGDIAVPAQNGPTWVKVGATTGFTVIIIVAVEAHCPALGVKV
jgi:hypothetical protein